MPSLPKYSTLHCASPKPRRAIPTPNFKLFIAAVDCASAEMTKLIAISLWHAECLYTVADYGVGFSDRIPAHRREAVRMANELRTEVEQVKEQEDVKRALKQTSTVKPEEKPKAQTKDKLWLGT